MVIKPVTETPDELAAFVSATFAARVSDKAPRPRWTGEFFRDFVLGHPDRTVDHALGAYANGKLLGTIMSVPYTMFIGDKRLHGAYGSWLAVESEGIRQLAAPHLIAELSKRLIGRGAHFVIGVTHRSGPGTGLDFWSSYARAFPRQVVVGPELKYWIRVIDGGRLADALRRPWLKLQAAIATIWPVRRSEPASEVRYYADGDFEGCADLFFRMPAQMRTAPSRADFAGDGNCGTRPQTLVLDRGRGIEAASSIYLQPMTDARPFQTGVIDHLVYRPQTKGISILIYETLRRLRDGGAILATLPMGTGQPIAQLLAAGFVPYRAEHYFVFQPLSNEAPHALSNSFLLPLR